MFSFANPLRSPLAPFEMLALVGKALLIFEMAVEVKELDSNIDSSIP